MQNFFERSSGVDRPSHRRYLWTDAFAVCNLLGLANTTRDSSYISTALQLINDVHHTLGRFRGDDARQGWISGLPEQTGAQHPTAGGLRIGKPLPERDPQEPYDERAEWNRDGQYFHYLTKWMHALDQTARTTGRSRYNQWARELADNTIKAFVYHPGKGDTPRMFWKMSIDLSRPLVPAMGQHDPLDGYITCLELRNTAAVLSQPDAEPDLGTAISELEKMVQSGNWASTDPLGIGGLLGDAYRIVQLQHRGVDGNRQLLASMLDAAEMGLNHYRRSNEIQFPPEYRLAFRELGLAIGLDSLNRMQHYRENETLMQFLPALLEFLPLRDTIVDFWRNPVHQNVPSWREHQDINEVMLVTALAPAGFLEIA